MHRPTWYDKIETVARGQGEPYMTEEEIKWNKSNLLATSARCCPYVYKPNGDTQGVTFTFKNWKFWDWHG